MLPGGASLATCEHCATLRVEEGPGVAHYILPDATEEEWIEVGRWDPDDDGRPMTRRRRVRCDVDPPCLSPSLRPRAA